MLLDIINYMSGENFTYIKTASDSLRFLFGNKQIIYTTGKKTPNKNGYFIRIYKKNSNNRIEQFNEKDVDYLLIKLNNQEYLFFPQKTLLLNNIIGMNGKIGWRVYSSKCKIDNKYAKKQQEWQKEFLHYINN